MICHMARIRNTPEEAEKTKYWNAALYIRLSREDGDKEESDSVGNQRSMLSQYLAEHPEILLFDYYVDDGYSGTNFDRPDFQRMIGDMEQGSVNCIIVKDLSRFGRNYIGVGEYQEMIFPKRNVRFIAVNDHIDSSEKSDDSQSLILPFTNIMNEQYARDISRKVRSALDIKRKRGEFIGAFASYGYQKDPNDRNKLIVDPEAAEVVRNIFRWFLEGTPKLTIANRLNDEGIPCPSEYKKQKGLRYSNANRLQSTTYWTHTSINRILQNQVYIGNLVQHTQTRKSFKIKQGVRLQKQDWMISENMHAPVIDRETWETAQRLLKSNTKKIPFAGESHLYSGLLKCCDCGRAMKRRSSHGIRGAYYVCGTYQAYGKKRCTSHSIRESEISLPLLREIQTQIKLNVDFTILQRELDDYRMQKIKKMVESRGHAALVQYEKRLEAVIRLKQGCYEDLKSGLLSRDDFLLLRDRYDAESQKLKESIAQRQLKENKSVTVGELGDRFDRLMQYYQNLPELSRKILVFLVESVQVKEDHQVAIHFAFSPRSTAAFHEP